MPGIQNISEMQEQIFHKLHIFFKSYDVLKVNVISALKKEIKASVTNQDFML